MIEHGKRRTTTPNTRGRLSLLLVIAVSAAAVVVGISAVGVPPTGLRFAQSGHWVAQPLSGVVAHVDGTTKRVDATARVPGLSPGAQVVQGPDSGYVVGSQRIVEFGKSTLSVRRTVRAPVQETPVTVEAPGGPYLIYQQAGRLVRFGPTPASLPAGGSVSRPVVTGDGTLWLHRVDSGVVCSLPAGTKKLSCPGTTTKGHGGQLTLVGDRPTFVDTTQNTLRPVSEDGLGQSVPLGVDVPDQASVAGQDATGKLAILDRPGKRLHLIDTAGLNGGKPAAPVSTDLPEDGDYRGPDSTGSTVVLLDVANNDLLTYRDGATTPQRTPVPTESGAPAGPGESGEPRLFHGEDGNVYLDGPQGKHVMVVDDTGTVTEVPIDGDQPGPEQNRPPLAQPEPQRPPAEDRAEDRQDQEDRDPGPIAQAPPPAQVTQPAPPPEPPRQPPPEPVPQPEPPERDLPRPATDNPRPDNPRPDNPAPNNPRPNPTPNNPAPNNPSPPKPKPPRPTPPKPPRPTPPKPKPPIPASQPGMPGSFTVYYDSYTTNAVASWTPAPANGSPLIGYYMSWSEGNRPIPGNQTSTFIIDFGNEEPFTVSLVARNAIGIGPAAVTTTIDGSTNPDCYADWDQICWTPETSPVRPTQSAPVPNATVPNATVPNAAPPTGQRRGRRRPARG